MTMIDTAAARLNCEISATGTEWMVMLHEIGGSLETWSRVVTAFDGWFRTLRYDQRGAGQSQFIREPFTLDMAVDDLHGLLGACGATACHLVAGAMGCALAVRYARLNPDRVRSLVLANPALRVSPDRQAYLAARAAKVEADGMTATVDDTLARSYPPPYRDAPDYDAYRARFLANDPQSYAAINRAFAAFDATPDLAAIACPTLVLGGLHDQLRPLEEVRDVARAIAGARLAVVNAGHIMPVQAPDDMIAAMTDFYSGLAPSSSLRNRISLSPWRRSAAAS